MKTKAISIPTIQQTYVAKKYVPKDMYSNITTLLNKILREEATHIERNKEYHTTVISSLNIGNTFQFKTNRIATPQIIAKENIAKGTSTLKLNGTEFNIDNATGRISTSKQTPKDKIKEFLEQSNNLIKDILENFNSEKITKNKTGIRGLVA